MIRKCTKAILRFIKITQSILFSMCPGYDTKLYPVMGLQFWSSEKYKVIPFIAITPRSTLTWSHCTSSIHLINLLKDYNQSYSFYRWILETVTITIRINAWASETDHIFPIPHTQANPSTYMGIEFFSARCRIIKFPQYNIMNKKNTKFNCWNKNIFYKEQEVRHIWDF